MFIISSFLAGAYFVSSPYLLFFYLISIRFRSCSVSLSFSWTCLSFPAKNSGFTAMHSPLPDASALEAGILEDETPSRLSRVQDNVRNLLRTSRFGSVHSSPPASPITNPRSVNFGLPTPPESPIRRASQPSEVLSSPSAESTTSTATSSTSTTQGDEVPGVLFPPAGYRHALQQMAHQSTLFNTRAVAALDHPDLSDPSLATYLQHKTETRQRRAWKRSRHGKKRHAAAKAGSSQCLLCVLAALLLAAIVATCMSRPPSEQSMSPC